MASLSARQFKAIIKKDIVMELRTREMLISMGMYSLLTMVVYYVALSVGEGFDIKDIAAGLLWLTFIFTSLLGLNRSLVHEKDQGCLEGLLLSPIDRVVIFFAKATGNLIFLLVVEMLTVPVLFFLFLQGRVFTGSLWMIALAVLAGSIGIAVLGTFLATMSVNTSGKDVMLAILFVPLSYPLLLGAVVATHAAIMGGPDAAVSFWQSMAWVGGFDAIMLVAAFGLYEFVIGA